MTDAALIAILAIGAFLLLPLTWLVAVYNRFMRLRQHIRESWADIDVELKRRYDLIPNLVQTVKGYAAHERDTLDAVIRARDRAMTPHPSAAAQAVDESALLLDLKKVFALAESYPALKADSHFLALQKELANTEDRIAAARRFYNGNVRELNQLCATVPTNLVARAFNITPASFFELQSEAERIVPRATL